MIFTIELVLKLMVYRLKFFKSGWNWFDLIIVAVSWASASSGKLLSAPSILFTRKLPPFNICLIPSSPPSGYNCEQFYLFLNLETP
ncbi:ion transporter [Pseudoalteromonas sp. OOF1S-7]|nr:ion transporter [Pseudoalteromonas sp. OOF1S-7]